MIIIIPEFEIGYFSKRRIRILHTSLVFELSLNSSPKYLNLTICLFFNIVCVLNDSIELVVEYFSRYGDT